MEKPQGVAVDASEELLYVADSGNNRIAVFDADTRVFIRAFGWGVKAGDTEAAGLDTCTQATGCQKGFAGAVPGQLREPGSIAVDPVSHHIYVGEETNHRVQKFAPTGSLVTSFGSKGDGLGQFNQIRGVAVGPGGTVHVADIKQSGFCAVGGDEYAKRVQKFSPAGSVLEQVTLTDAPCGYVDGFAVDSPGNLYLGNGGATGAVRKYDPAGNLLKTLDPSTDVHAIAVDAADNLFVADSTSTSPTGSQLASAVIEYDSTGTLLRTIYGSIDQSALVSGIAPFHGAGGDLFVVEGSFGLGRVLHVPFPPPGPVVYPGSTMAANVRSVRATAEAKLNPEGKVTTYHFDYIRDDQFIAAGNSFGAGTISTPESDVIGSDFKLHVAAQTINGLASETTYHFRIVASNADATVTGEEGTFTTLVPLEIGATWSTDVGSDSARLHAQVNPLGTAATGYFEFVDDATYRHDVEAGPGHGFDHAGTIPGVTNGAAPLDLGDGEMPKAIAAQLSGLLPRTTYHYRVIATDHCKPAEPTVICTFTGPERALLTLAPRGALPSCAANQQFRTGPSAALADCRAYEMVSSPDKQGGGILSAPELTGYSTGLEKSAAAGNGFTYSAYHGFAEPKSGALAFQYLAHRAPGQGWSTEPISPERGYRSVYGSNRSLDSEFKAFSEDLGSAWLLHDTAPLDPCTPEGFGWLYRRDNSDGAYEALSCATPVNTPPFADSTNYPPYGAEAFYPELQGISADGAHAVFRVADKLTPDAAPGTNVQLYESSPGGGLRLVSVLPNGTPSGDDATAGTSSKESISNHREQSVLGAVSADGSRVFWTAAPTTGNPAGALIPGKLYVRLNATEPQSAMTGNKCSEAEKACTIAVSETVSGAPAQFETASPDGTKAIFKFENQGKGDLYEFSVAKAKAILIAHKVMKSILGASEDASRVYFASEEALTAANAQGVAPVAGKPNLYFYDSSRAPGDRFRFIGSFADKELAPEGESVGPFIPRPVLHTARVSADGQTAIFTSFASLTGYDNADADTGVADREVFLYDAASEGGKGALHCISCNPSGARPEGELETQTGNTGLPLPTAAVIPGAQFQLYFSRALSEDGKRAFFNSYDSLVLSDTNGVKDVYQWEAPGSGSCSAEDSTFVPGAGGCITLLSSGQSSSPSEFLDASSSGADVFIRTAESLLVEDVGLIDVYDARVDGGFPPPPGRPAACEGEACQGPLSAPDDPTPASSSFEGAGNVRPEAKAKKKQKKKAQQKKRRRHHKANRHGRAAR